MPETTTPQLTEREWLSEIERALTVPQRAAVEAILNKRRKWLRGVRDCPWCGRLGADLNSHPCFDAEETAVAFTLAALREQLAAAERERDRARTQLTEAEKVLKAYGWTRR